MDIPEELPIIYTTPILIPGFILKIRLQVDKHANILNYVQTNRGSKIFIGVIPISDFDKAKNIIGTVGLVLSKIKIDSVPEDFILVMQGIWRFKLDMKIHEAPLQINKITIIENLQSLQGDKKEIEKLFVEFSKAVNTFLTYSTQGLILHPLTKKSLKITLNDPSLYKTVDYILKNFVHITPSDTYTILRATSLNDVMKFVTDCLKRETIDENKYSKSEKTGLIPVQSKLPNAINENGSDSLKKPISQELKQILITIKSVV